MVLLSLKRAKELSHENGITILMEIKKCIEEMHHKNLAWANVLTGFNEEEAQDILQEVYIKLWSGSAKFEEKSGASFSTWLFSVIKNTQLDRFRTRNRRNKIDLELFKEADLVCYQKEFIDKDKIKRALKRLSPKQKIIFDMMFFKDMTLTEIAKELKVSLPTISVQISRGKRTLCKAL